MQYNFIDFKNELKKVEEFLSKEYSQISTGRASPIVLDSISVETYGSRQPIKNVASISIEDPKTLRIAPWDKNQIKAIEKSILIADLGLSVATDEAGIRVIFPQLTSETRQKLMKVVREKLEESRITVRRERGNVWDEIQRMQKDGEMNEDEKARSKDELQKVIDDVNSNLESIFEKKEKEVLG
ncbi:MAG: ribosome recycling factor [Candidatus Paceibacterota bacterium]